MFFDRSAGQGTAARKQTAVTKSFPGPVRGWIQSQSPGNGPAGGADLLINIIPTKQGGRVRGGKALWATIAADMEYLASYNGGSKKIFACDATKIYDATSPITPSTPLTAAVTGQTSGDYSSALFTPGSGNPYLVMVNGADDMQQFDGSNWLAINDTTGGGRAITGVATDALSFVWGHQKRLWFIQKGSMSAWYLPVIQVAGAASEFPLGSVFKHGGELVFGATWSISDAGDGLDDKIAFFTSRGEVAVYSGNDPGSNFTLDGVYQIGTPLHKNAHFKAGGDVVVLTDNGAMPLSAALSLVGEALLSKAVTANIEDGWKAHVENRKDAGHFNCTIWPDRSMLLVGMPTPNDLEPRALAAYTGNGAWGEITDWDIRCSVVHDGMMLIGSTGGQIWQVDETGSDNGMPYQCIYLPSFDTFKSVSEKSLVHARYVTRGDAYDAVLFGNVDFNPDVPSAGTPSAVTSDGIWDTAEWDADNAIWQSASDYKSYVSEWQTVAGYGNAVSVGLSVTMGQVQRPIFEIMRIDLVYQQGRLMG